MPLQHAMEELALAAVQRLRILLAQASVAPLITKQGGKRKAEEEAGATDGEGGAAAAKVRWLGRICRVTACLPASSSLRMACSCYGGHFCVNYLSPSTHAGGQGGG